MKVVWKPGYSPAGVTAQTAYETVHALYEQGKSSAKDLVDASRPEDAPLHSLFEWNDSVAAERYRENQARIIIVHIATVDDSDPDEEKEQQQPIRAFFNVDSERNAKYEPTQIILRDEKKRETLLDIAKRELFAFEAKYRSLRELCKVFDAIDDLRTEGEGDD